VRPAEFLGKLEVAARPTYPPRAAIDDVMKTDTIYLNDMVYFTYTQQDRIEAIWFLEEKVFREWIGTYERWYFDVMSEKEEKK
jgi:hypothetical protein